MPPRLPICTRCLRRLQRPRSTIPSRTLATATAITPAPSPIDTLSSSPPIARYPPTQPPSHKPPEFRKSQLHRQYTSLLRSTPLLLLFQHTNLKATEWMAVRRELAIALEKVDEASSTDHARDIRIQTIQSGIFQSALAVTEHFHPSLQTSAAESAPPHATDPATQSSASHIPNLTPSRKQPELTHALSTAARNASHRKKNTHPFAPLLVGPVAALTFPTVSPAHLKAALSILAPEKPGFPAPTRRANPGYYEAATQAGLQKLLLLGARVEGRVFDSAGSRWVGGLEGGLDGLRAQVVAMLGGVAAGVTNVLEGAGRGVWFTLEGRKVMLEEEEGKAKGTEEGKQEKKD